MDLSEIYSRPNNHIENSSEDVSKDLFSRKKVYVGISDTGKGISSNIMPKLYGKFITDPDYGTGLGLYITKMLVEAHGGRIWDCNNNDGVGSNFVFSLPKFDDTRDNVRSVHSIYHIETIT